jgi:hypothetical protein
MLGNYRVAAQLVAFQVVLSSTELVMRKEATEWDIFHGGWERMLL